LRGRQQFFDNVAHFGMRNGKTFLPVGIQGVPVVESFEKSDAPSHASISFSCACAGIVLITLLNWHISWKEERNNGLSLWGIVYLAILFTGTPNRTVLDGRRLFVPFPLFMLSADLHTADRRHHFEPFVLSDRPTFVAHTRNHANGPVRSHRIARVDHHRPR